MAYKLEKITTTHIILEDDINWLFIPLEYYNGSNIIFRKEERPVAIGTQEFLEEARELREAEPFIFTIVCDNLQHNFEFKIKIDEKSFYKLKDHFLTVDLSP